jgi:hypothetical protein
VEGDDDGLYVVKFRGAGQGPLALVADLVGGETGRLLGLNVPELVFVEVDEALGRNEPDEEIRHLLRASVGLNLGLDYLPGSVMFDPAARDTADSDTASRAVWFDAFLMNVDRTAKNPNLLYWHKALYFIDHGAALYFHHNWETAAETAATTFKAIRQHVLLSWATNIEGADRAARERISEDALNEIVRQVPAAWLAPVNHQVYLEHLRRRLAAAPKFTGEAIRAHHELV